jgi:hypothetical protein
MAAMRRSLNTLSNIAARRNLDSTPNLLIGHARKKSRKKFIFSERFREVPPYKSCEPWLQLPNSGWLGSVSSDQCTSRKEWNVIGTRLMTQPGAGQPFGSRRDDAARLG